MRPVRGFELAQVLLVLATTFAITPIPDETYYWAWSRQLGLVYLDHPPASAWVLRGTTWLLGDGLLGLRVASFGAIVASWALLTKTAKIMGGPTAERTTSMALMGAPMFVIGLVPFTPDPLHAAVTSLSAYATVKSFEERRSLWTFVAPVSFVLAVGIKHYAAFVSLGALFGMATSFEGRGRLAEKRAVLGVVVGVVLLLPWLAAEASVGFPSIHFQLQRVFVARSRGLVGIPLSIGSMFATLGLLGGALFFWGLGRIALATNAERVLLLGGGALVLACVFAAVRGSGEANWPLPGFLFALPAASAIAARHTPPRVVSFLGVVGAAVVTLLLMHAVVPFLPIAVNKDPTRRGEGFERVAVEAEAASRDLGNAVLVTRRYQWASLLRWHVRDRAAVYELGTPGGRLSQYDRWPRPRVCKGDAIVYLGSAPELPSDLSAEVLGHSKRVTRGVGLEDWWIVPSRTREDLSCPR